MLGLPYFLTGIGCDTGQRENCPSLALRPNYRQLPTSGRYARATAVPKSSSTRYRYRSGIGFGRGDSFLQSSVIVSQVTVGRPIQACWLGGITNPSCRTCRPFLLGDCALASEGGW
jgi:hypothetical protein